MMASRSNRFLWVVACAAACFAGGRAAPAIAEEPAPEKKPAPAAKEARLTNGIGMKLVLIRPGEFLMGSPEDERGRLASEKQHRVRITKPFYFAETKVTRGEFNKFVKDTGYRTEPEIDGKGGMGYDLANKKIEQSDKYSWKNTGFDQTDEHPVVNVTWNDAAKFCEWLSAREGRKYRLPTEAEWEFACRGGSKTAFHGGDDPEKLVQFGNIADGAARDVFSDWKETTRSRDGFIFTSPVRSFRPNALGLFDLHGNACEWCSDWYGAEYYSRSPADDPPGPAEGSLRANRGGCWGSPAGTCRSASRHSYTPSTRHYGIGFRVAAAAD